MPSLVSGSDDSTFLVLDEQNNAIGAIFSYSMFTQNELQKTFFFLSPFPFLIDGHEFMTGSTSLRDELYPVLRSTRHVSATTCHAYRGHMMHGSVAFGVP
jgi:hypothetical protein